MKSLLILIVVMIVFSAVAWILGEAEEPGWPECRGCPEWDHCQGRDTDCWWRWGK